MSSLPLCGIIEGFFGRPWRFEERKAYAQFLADAGYDFYLYAPKKDPHLRRRWQTPWPTQERQQMDQLRNHYADLKVKFGLGLSPFELYKEPWSVARSALRQKLKELKSFAPDMLGLLFDDMRGDFPELAQRQVDLAHVCADMLPDTQLILCPTYYSFDPVLDQVFGQRPAAYLDTLGSRLDPIVSVFWTGPEVCSRTYPQAHLQEVEERLRRKPFLWDNYPVNDGKKISRFLHLRSFNHETQLLSQHLSGHAVNPMNQPFLSQIPLWTLPQNYQQQNYDAHTALRLSLEHHCAPAVAEALLKDLPLLQDKGLDEMGSAQQHALQAKYTELALRYRSVHAQETADFLAEDYAFDESCLTD